MQSCWHCGTSLIRPDLGSSSVQELCGFVEHEASGDTLAQIFSVGGDSICQAPQ